MSDLPMAVTMPHSGSLLHRRAYALSFGHASVDIITGVMFTNAEGFVASGQIKNGDVATGHLGAHLSGSTRTVLTGGHDQCHDIGQRQ